MFEKTTATGIAKWAVNKTIAVTVGGMVAKQITDHTEKDEDALLVVIPSAVVGWTVANQTDKVTDPMVEKIANWLASRKSHTTDNLTVVQ